MDQTAFTGGDLILKGKAIPAVTENSVPFFLPNLSHRLFGREAEIQSFFRFFDRKQVFSIQGMPGIGKTFLMSYLARRLSADRSTRRFSGKTFFIEVKNGWESQTFLDCLCSCLSQAGEGMTFKTGSDVFEPFSEKIINLLGILNRNSYAIFIDDFHFFPTEVQVELLEPLLKYLSASKVIFSSCADLPFSPVEKLNLWETRLRELEEDATIALFQELTDGTPGESLKEKGLRRIHPKTGGHPFTVKLLASAYLGSGKDLGKILDLSSQYSKAVQSYLVKRVLDTLTSSEKKCLELFICLRSSFESDLFELGASPKLVAGLSGLRRKLLLDRTPEGRIQLHSLVREQGCLLVSEEELRQNHAWWAGFFRRTMASIPHGFHGHFLSEYVFHLALSGEIEEAGKAFQGSLAGLYQQGKFDEIMILFQLFHEKGFPLEQKSMITKAKILYIQGKWGESKSLLRNLRETGSQDLQPNILMCLGHIEVCKDRIDSSIAIYRKSLDLAKQLGQEAEQAEALYYLGDSFFYQRKFRKALLAFQRSRRRYEAIGLSDGVIDALLKKALVLQALGRVKAAGKIFRNSVAAYERNHNVLGLAETHLHLSALAFRERSFEAALEHLEHSREGFDAQRNVLKMLFLKVLHGKILFFQEKYQDAEKALTEATVLAAEFDQGDALGECSFFLARLALDRGDFAQARKRVSIRMNIFEPHIGARLELLKCFIFVVQGDLRSAETGVQEAKGWLDAEDNGPLRSLIEMIQSRLLDPGEKHIRAENISPSDSSWWETAGLEQYLTMIEATFSSPRSRVFTREGERFEFAETIANWKKAGTFALLFDRSDGCAYLENSRVVNLSGKPRLSGLLELFIRNPGQRFSHADLYRLVWQQEYDGEIHHSNVRSQISRLRQAIDPGSLDGEFKMILKSAGQNEFFFNPQITFCLVIPPTIPFC